MLSYLSNNYTQAYIIHSESSMIEPILTPNGRVDDPGIIQSKEATVSPNQSGDVTVPNNGVVINSVNKPTEQQISKETYYSDIAKSKALLQGEIYSIINQTESDAASVTKLIDQEPRFTRLADTTPAVKAATAIYDSAYVGLVRMLTGKDSLDLKKAIFMVENAYYNNTLDYTRYLKQIDRLVGICKYIIKKNGYSPADKLACNYAIQSLYSDTIKYEGRTLYPVTYDFDDFLGNKDYSKQFVTKLLNAGSGQCHSMPLLYMILAQELHTEAYLVLAPSHSYIKYPMGNTLYGFECTNGQQTNDAFMMASGYLSAMAVRKQIYLEPLGLKQVIVQCLVDLSTQYALQYGNNDFTLLCCQTALQYNPQCIGALQGITNAGIAWCAHIAAQYHNPPLVEYAQYPKLKTAFDNMVNLQAEIDNTGYIRIPKEQYIAWLESARTEEEKKVQIELKNKLYSSLKRK